MNRLKRELIRCNFYINPDDMYKEVSRGVTLESASVRVFHDEFVRVTVHYNCITVDFLLDNRFNQIEINEINEPCLTGGLMRDDALKNKRVGIITEYNDGIRIFRDEKTDRVIYAEKFDRTFAELEKERRDKELLSSIMKQLRII